MKRFRIKQNRADSIWRIHLWTFAQAAKAAAVPLVTSIVQSLRDTWLDSLIQPITNAWNAWTPTATPDRPDRCPPLTPWPA